MLSFSLFSFSFNRQFFRILHRIVFSLVEKRCTFAPHTWARSQLATQTTSSPRHEKARSFPKLQLTSSFSRVSFQDDLDECDFSLPFDVDDVDTSNSVPSQGQVNPSSDARRGLDFTSPTFSMGRTSQDAAVGALVQMLRTAPPLRQQQDLSYYSATWL